MSGPVRFAISEWWVGHWDRLLVAVRGERCSECGGRLKVEFFNPLEEDDWREWVRQGWEPGEIDVCIDCGMVQ